LTGLKIKKMPIPIRRKGTPKDEFLGKCIAKLKGEYPVKQATAICYQQMRADKKKLNNI